MYITQQATIKMDIRAKFQYPIAPAYHGYKKEQEWRNITLLVTREWGQSCKQR
jgi:hypothetical protein